MRSIGIIRRFKTRNFIVVVDAIEDYDIDLSWDADGSVRAGLNSGEYIAFCARARVFLNGSEIAADYLGNCIYTSPEAFMDHKECGRQTRELRAKGDTAIVGSYFHDMIRAVCREARETLTKQKSIYIRT